jgi:alpha-tubulin suppressor-like RCC1 family protein
MLGRKLSTVAIVASLGAVAGIGACRDDATTGASDIPSRDLAANLQLQAGDFQTGSVALPLAQMLRVRVVDAGGLPVSGAGVTWSVLAGGGSVTPPTGISDANGNVSTTWTMGTTLGENRVRADLLGAYLLDSVTFLATAVAGAPVTIEILEGFELPETIRVASIVEELRFLVRDQFDHPVVGATVTFATGLNSGTVNPLTDQTDSGGIAVTRWTVGTVTGAQSVTAAIPGQLPVVLNTIATPDTSRRLAIVVGDGQAGMTGATLAVPLQVRVTDRFNNAVTGDQVIFSDSLGSGDIVTPTTTVSDATGIAQATWRLSSLAGPHRLRVRTPGSGGQFVRFNATGQLLFRDVFAGDYYTCAVGTNDRAYCWGFGEDGQLATNSLVTRSGPSWPVTRADTIAGPYPTLRDVSGGRSHACGVGISRTIFCWGFNPDLRFLSSQASSPTRVPIAIDIGSVTTPLASTRYVGAGESHSCAVTLGGIAMCAGNNERGQGGAGVAPTPLLPPTQVDTVTIGLAPAGVPPRFYSHIAVGERHACGMPRFDTLFVLASQTPWCWGQNNNGQLGDGLPTFADSARPSMVVMPLAATAGFDSTSLVAGASHTCALDRIEPVAGLGSTAYCWGSHALGQLGAGALVGSNRSSAPLPVLGLGGTPVMFRRLFSGENHTCGLTAGGAAFCWGRNSSGQLGDGTQVNSSIAVAVAGGFSFRTLALGELHTCGVVGAPSPVPVGTTGTPGEVRCWGDNEYGQLGLAVFGVNSLSVLVPTRVAFQQ